jgi:hypothetical protein
MATHEANDLSVERRKEIFLSLVSTQDKGVTVLQSRMLISQQFNVSDAQVRQIEREGIDNEWPPL